ncbi:MULTISPECIES: hypothetical protein [unclassified Luteimonas]
MSDRATPIAPFMIAAALVAAAALAPLPAEAIRVVAQATAICQGALPAFETQIRKRPLAVQNEGGTNAFVTCSFNNPGNSNGSSRVSRFTVYLQNMSSARTVSCTAVNSGAGANGSDALYATKSIRVLRDEDGSTALDFEPGDFVGGAFLLPGDAVSVSCNLLPGIGITSTVLVNNAN